jgi:hypothetical protein
MKEDNLVVGIIGGGHVWFIGRFYAWPSIYISYYANASA